MVPYDIHIHTRLSECSGDPNSTVPNFAKLFEGTSIRSIGISDHMWDSDVPGASDWYRPQDFAHICRVREQITSEADLRGLKVIFGCETEFDKNGTLAITREHAMQLDYVLAPHSHTHMLDFVMPAECRESYEKHAKFMVESFLRLVNHKDIDVITSVAHPFAPCADEKHTEQILGCISEQEFEDCFKSAKDAGVFLELNASCFRVAFGEHPDIATSQYSRMYQIAKECGCRFTYGSDSHSPSRYFLFDWMDKAVEGFGLTQADFVPFEEIARKK